MVIYLKLRKNSNTIENHQEKLGSWDSTEATHHQYSVLSSKNFRDKLSRSFFYLISHLDELKLSYMYNYLGKKICHLDNILLWKLKFQKSRKTGLK